MKKRSDKKYPILLVFSALLFSTAIYFMSSSLALGASVGGSVPEPVTVDGGAAVAPSATPLAPEAELSREMSTENAVAENKENEVSKKVYVVKNGQTLWEIAQDSGVSIQTLMNQNQLSNSVIIEGQELVLD